jgi:hypothetical protein
MSDILHQLSESQQAAVACAVAMVREQGDWQVRIDLPDHSEAYAYSMPYGCVAWGVNRGVNNITRGVWRRGVYAKRGKGGR